MADNINNSEKSGVGGRMTFTQHLYELRKRILISLGALFTFFLISMFYQNELVEFLCMPHEKAAELLKADYKSDELAPRPHLISFKYGSPFISYMKMAFLISIFLSSPIIAIQIWKFISAGLYSNEKSIVYYFVPASFILFVSGCVIGYLILTPYCLYFLAKYTNPSSNPALISLDYSISEYLDLIILLTVIAGGVFQIPLVMALLSKINLINYKTYLKGWRFAIVIIWIVSAVITPPDVVSQIMFGIPMTILYFIGVLLAWMMTKNSTG